MVDASGLIPVSLGQSQMQIFGNFGSDQGTVTVGGQAVPVVTGFWGPTEILVDLPQGAVGDVIVTVRNHQSNVARLTEWQGQFSFGMRSLGASGGDLTETVTVMPTFRADIREYRPVIHQPPVGPFGGVEAVIPGPSGRFSCSGTAKYSVPMSNPPQVITYSWSGTGTLPVFDNSAGQPPTQYFSFSGDLTQSNTAMTTRFDLSGGPHACTATISGAPGPFFFDVNQLGFIDGNGFVTGNFVLTLDPTTAVIQSGRLAANVPGCLFQPPNNSCIGVLHWDAIATVGNTAPDPNSAR